MLVQAALSVWNNNVPVERQAHKLAAFKAHRNSATLRQYCAKQAIDKDSWPASWLAPGMPG
jgi:hypothetical protein